MTYFPKLSAFFLANGVLLQHISLSFKLPNCTDGWFGHICVVFDSFGMVFYPCQLPPFKGVTHFPSTGPAGSVRLTMMSTCHCPCTYAVGQEVGAQVTARPCLEPQQCCILFLSFLSCPIHLLCVCWRCLLHPCHHMLLALAGMLD